jgi:hypothetical protein
VNEHPPERRIVGVGDTFWIATIALSTAVVAQLLIGHLRAEFELYRIGNEIAYATSERLHLEDEQRRLFVERELRMEAFDLTEEANDLGLTPARASQIRAVDPR